MKKIITITFLSLVVYACSHKTKTAVTEVKEVTTTTEKTSSKTVSNARYLEGKTVYETYCGKCHKLFEPQHGNMTQWDKWIDRMAPKAKIDDAQKALIRDYISVNALTN